MDNRKIKILIDCIEEVQLEIDKIRNKPTNWWRRLLIKFKTMEIEKLKQILKQKLNQ